MAPTYGQHPAARLVPPHADRQAEAGQDGGGIREGRRNTGRFLGQVSVFLKQVAIDLAADPSDATFDIVGEGVLEAVAFSPEPQPELAGNCEAVALDAEESA
jgi:hypothetical protein